MSERADKIKDLPIFRLLNPDELECLTAVTTAKNIPAGEAIFSENDDGDTMYVINSGTVKITKKFPDRAAEMITLYAGDFFGEIALFDRVPRTGAAVAIEDTALLTIDREQFARLISEKPYAGIKILYRIIQDMAKRLQRMNVQSGDIFI